MHHCFYFVFRKAISEKVKAEYIESIETWRTLYEDLYSKVKPFQVSLCLSLILAIYLGLATAAMKLDILSRYSYCSNCPARISCHLKKNPVLQEPISY